jgi:hypothetical protein
MADNKIVWYVSRQGRGARYYVVSERRDRGRPGRLLYVLRPADYTGGMTFTVPADRTSPITQHHTGRVRPEPELGTFQGEVVGESSQEPPDDLELENQMENDAERRFDDMIAQADAEDSRRAAEAKMERDREWAYESKVVHDDLTDCPF